MIGFLNVKLTYRDVVGLFSRNKSNSTTTAKPPASNNERCDPQSTLLTTREYMHASIMSNHQQGTKVPH